MHGLWSYDINYLVVLFIQTDIFRKWASDRTQNEVLWV